MKAYSVISDFSPKAIQMLENAGIGVTINSGERPNEEELIDLVQKYDILIIGAKERMTKKVYEKCSQLKILGTLSIGMDHICGEFKSSGEIKIVNTPTANVVSVAEHTYGLILALNKRFQESRISVINKTGRNGIVKRPIDLYGKTLGIIGAGKIASKVIEISRVFGLRVLCYTYHPELHQELLSLGVEFVSLNQLLVQSDIVSVHVALSEQSRHLIGVEELSIMKSNAVLINTARREIIDMDALLAKIKKDSSFRAGLDIEIEPDHELFNIDSPNVIITPHIAGVSIDAINRMDPELSENILKNL